ncbi:MAG TPA: hypothetical protein VFG59_21425 [Anaeromyxobacter sp.]|nr:hypothetical protein [Anaeromyxobacter sp.]
MLYLIGILLLAAWVVGLALKVTVAAFHLLLLLGLAAIVWAYVRGRTRRTAA